MSFVRKQPHERNSMRRAVTPRRIPRPDYLSSFFGAAAAGQRLDPLDFFACLLVYGGVAEVDRPVQTRVRVVLVFGGWMRWVRGRLLCGHEAPPRGPGPGESPLLRGRLCDTHILTFMCIRVNSSTLRR